MKRQITAVLTACMVLLCGCSGGTGTENMAETLPPMTEVPEPVLVYYVNDHGTTDTGVLTQFMGKLSECGYTVQEDALASLPMNADAVVISAPQEDMTSEELQKLDLYMDQGGHVLLLMPANESETRFKYFERFLEEYCVLMDYDRIEETSKARMSGEDPTHILIDQIHAPLGMSIQPETAERALYLRNVRSFHFAVMDNFDSIQQDLMLRTAGTATGIPCGGTADDPETFEGETLTTMLYSRNDQRQNSFVVCVGASDFLEDAQYDLETSKSAQDYVFAAFEWMAHPVFS